MNIKVFLLIAVVFSSVTAEEVMVDTPKVMNPEWERKFLGVRRDVTDVVGSVEELTAGTTPNFGEEFLGKLRTAIQQQPTGEYIEHWPNGKLKARIRFKNRQAHGHIHGWYEDGTDAFKGYFQEGIKQGMHINFFPYGPDRVSDVARVLIYNEKGLLDDKQLTMHYATGQLNIYVDYKEGLAEGPLECWDVKGNQYLSANYNHGQLQKYPLPPTPGQREYRFKPFTIYVDEITRRFETEVEIEYGLVATMSGADMPKDLEAISVGFTKHKKTTIEEARELMVVLKDKFVTIINEHEKIRPYLREYPFPPERAEINLSFRKSDGNSYGKDGVDFVLMGKGNIVHYKIDDPKNPHRFKQIHEEPYEEAVKIVRGSSKQ